MAVSVVSDRRGRVQNVGFTVSQRIAVTADTTHTITTTSNDIVSVHVQALDAATANPTISISGSDVTLTWAAPITDTVFVTVTAW